MTSTSYELDPDEELSEEEAAFVDAALELPEFGGGGEEPEGGVEVEDGEAEGAAD